MSQQCSTERIQPAHLPGLLVLHLHSSCLSINETDGLTSHRGTEQALTSCQRWEVQSSLQSAEGNSSMRGGRCCSSRAMHIE